MPPSRGVSTRPGSAHRVHPAGSPPKKAYFGNSLPVIRKRRMSQNDSERGPGPMHRRLDVRGAEVLKKLLETRGVRVQVQKHVTRSVCMQLSRRARLEGRIV